MHELAWVDREQVWIGWDRAWVGNLCNANNSNGLVLALTAQKWCPQSSEQSHCLTADEAGEAEKAW